MQCVRDHIGKPTVALEGAGHMFQCLGGSEVCLLVGSSYMIIPISIFLSEAPAIIYNL
jgi:hypothetical protein